ncbi:MAG TPA: hypothetical protein VLN49_01710 [Gemmatimonadaceae bacterium]|nr:hypothetical protein [Gemmatimonadaceae bacterium]
MLAIMTSVAEAQDRHVAIEAAIGLVPPVGIFADRYEAGVHAAVGLERRNPGSHVGWRVEGTWDDFSPKYGGRDNHARAGSLTANGTLTLTPPRFTAVGLYAIGGVGYYNTRESALFHGTQSDIGFNGGGGLRFRIGAVRLYVEGRLHDIPVAQMYFVPLTLGVAF